MRAWVALRALARVERRQLVRHRRRSLLVVLLVAVPVAAIVGGGTLLRITEPTPDERRIHAMGRAALRVDLGSGAAASTRMVQLPADARVEDLFTGVEEVRVPGRSLCARFFALAANALEPNASDSEDLDGVSLARGMLRVTEGRSPSGVDEVALSPVLREGLGVALGRQVTLSPGVPKTITGVVVDPEDLSLPVVLRVNDPEQPTGARSLLIDLAPPAAATAAGPLGERGFTVTAREETGAPDPFSTLVVFVIGGIGLFEAALVIAAAFGVGLRRRQREIGLLGASGATAGGMRASLLFSAALLASVGGALGVAGGLGLAAALHPFLDGWNGRWNGGFEVSPTHVVGAVLLGLLAATAAAVVPAVTATRLPILVALGGRRPVTTGSSRWLGVGLSMVSIGALALVLGSQGNDLVAGTAILGGSLLAVLGFGVCSPWLLHALARVAAPLPLAWRLAVRDAGRFRARYGPVVTAVLAGMAISVMLGALLASVEARLDGALPLLRSDQLVVEGPAAEDAARRVASELSPANVVPWAAAYVDGAPVRVVREREDDASSEPRFGRWIACGGPELCRVLGVDGAPRSMHLVSASGRALGVHAVHVVPRRSHTDPEYVIDERVRASIGAETGPPPHRPLVPWRVHLESPVTPPLLARAQRIAAEVPGTAVDAALQHRRPTRVFLYVVLLLCLVTGLLVVFVATALSSVESAADAVVLHCVGASPSLLRRHVAARAGYLAFLGGVLAVPAGLLPLGGLLSTTNVPLDFAIPWLEVGIAVIAFPALAYVCTWLVARPARGSAAPRCVA